MIILMMPLSVRKQQCNWILIVVTVIEKGEKPRLKPCPKYPVKAHVWVGINKKEATSACIFKGKWILYFIVQYFKEHYNLH